MSGSTRSLRQRTRDKHETIAAAGRPNGGDPFGYRHGLDAQGQKSLIVHEEEAAAVRWAAGRRAERMVRPGAAV